MKEEYWMRTKKIVRIVIWQAGGFRLDYSLHKIIKWIKIDVKEMWEFRA